jgi:predicted peroxiredoxin
LKVSKFYTICVGSILVLTVIMFQSPGYIFAVVRTPLVYHLSSDEPWRATVAISDATNMLKLGHNVTLLLSIEGVQIGVKNPHHYLGLHKLTRNVTNFVAAGGTVIICEVCLRIAGYNNNDILPGAIVGEPIISSLLNNVTVIDY